MIISRRDLARYAAAIAAAVALPGAALARSPLPRRVWLATSIDFGAEKHWCAHNLSAEIAEKWLARGAVLVPKPVGASLNERYAEVLPTLIEDDDRIDVWLSDGPHPECAQRL